VTLPARYRDAIVAALAELRRGSSFAPTDACHIFGDSPNACLPPPGTTRAECAEWLSRLDWRQISAVAEHLVRLEESLRDPIRHYAWLEMQLGYETSGA
jgi:hypothetical protein